MAQAGSPRHRRHMVPLGPLAGMWLLPRRRRRGEGRFLVVAVIVAVAVLLGAWVDDPAPERAPLASPDPSSAALAADSSSGTQGQPSANIGPPPTHEVTSHTREAPAHPTASSGPGPPARDHGATSTSPESAAPDPIDEPVRVEIPAVGVDARLVAVGLNGDGSMAVPDFGLAGWYTEGPAPGAPGPAVIAAHVDSYKGPDVFFRLRELEPGDEIQVHGADGRTLTWEVSTSELVAKVALPTQRIWNDTDQPVLRLITCGGTFDRSAKSYLSNLIVYATPTGR